MTLLDAADKRLNDDEQENTKRAAKESELQTKRIVFLYNYYREKNLNYI